MQFRHKLAQLAAAADFGSHSVVGMGSVAVDGDEGKGSWWGMSVAAVVVADLKTCRGLLGDQQVECEVQGHCRMRQR